METTNNQILFSIIIPCYNRSDIIIETLKSLALQTYNNFEAIVIDDGSSDNLFEAVNNFNKSLKINIKYVKNNKNMGLSIARFNGVLQSKGNWIVLLDSDDIFFPETLEMYKNQILLHPDIDYFGAVWTDSALRRERQHEDIITRSSQDYTDFLRKDPKDYHGCYSKKLLDKVPFLTTKSPGGEFFHRIEFTKEFSCKFLGIPQGIMGDGATSRLSIQARKKVPWLKNLTLDEKNYLKALLIHYSSNKEIIKMCGPIHLLMWKRIIIKLLFRNKNYVKSSFLLISYFINKFTLKG